jgi:hypothetical protein
VRSGAAETSVCSSCLAGAYSNVSGVMGYHADRRTTVEAGAWWIGFEGAGPGMCVCWGV